MIPQIFSAPLWGMDADLLNTLALVLILLVAALLVYMIVKALRKPRFASGRRSKQARLAITDAALIDERRKLVLVRRDNVEHLVLIGGANDLVIEADIGKGPAIVADASGQRVSTAPAQASAPQQPATQPAKQRVPVNPAPPIPAQPAPTATKQTRQEEASARIRREPTLSATPAPAPVPSSQVSSTAPQKSNNTEAPEVAPAPRTTVGDDMSALLEEIGKK